MKENLAHTRSSIFHGRPVLMLWAIWLHVLEHFLIGGRLFAADDPARG